MQVLDLIEDSWKANLNVIIGRAIYQRVMLRLSNLFYAKCAQSTTLVTYALMPRLHRSVCRLSCMEAMVHIANNKMGSNMYQCVWFPCLVKNMVFKLGATYVV